MRAYTERHAKIVGQRPDIEATRTRDLEPDQIALYFENIKLGHVDGHGRWQRRLPGRLMRARQPIASTSVDFLGRKRRRLLQKRSPKGVERSFDAIGCRHHAVIRRRRRTPRPVIGVGGEPESNRGVVTLRIGSQELREPGGAADHQEQHAAGQRIKRAGVTDAAFPQHAAYARHHVVRCRTDRFVHDEQAVQGHSGKLRIQN
jgi:hypothetical protein